MNAFRPIRIVAPATLPVSLREVQDYLRIADDSEDLQIDNMIRAAVSYLDGYTGILGRCMITQTWRQDFDMFPRDRVLRLPFPDVQIATVTYIDADGASQELDGATVSLVDDHRSATLVLADGATWPDTEARPDAVQVQMVCGYGAASAVPHALKMAILLHVSALYDQRDGVVSGPAYDALVAPYRVL